MTQGIINIWHEDDDAEIRRSCDTSVDRQYGKGVHISISGVEIGHYVSSYQLFTYGNRNQITGATLTFTGPVVFGKPPVVDKT